MNSDRIGRILWWGGLAVLLLGISGSGFIVWDAWEDQVGGGTRVADQLVGISLVVIALSALSPIVMLAGAIFKVVAWAKEPVHGDQEN